MKNNFQVIIVGQGLAGSALSLLLQQAGIDFLLLSSPAHPAASAVAGGICNPVVAKRFVPSWNGEEFLNTAAAFYEDWERKLSTAFFYRRSLYKIIGADQEIIHFRKRYESDEQLRSHAANELKFFNEASGIINPLGCVKIITAATLETRHYLQSVKDFFEQKDRFAEDTFDYNLLEIKTNGIHYKQWRAQSIVFCDGWYAAGNPLLNALKFRFAKGEILELEIPGLQLNEIIKKQVYLVPCSNGKYLAGATYAWDNLDNKPTAAGRNELETELKKIITVPYTITGHYAGVRPATYDRRPFLGSHPQHRNVGIFNGLGTRGAMLAPKLSEMFMEYFFGGKELPKDVSVERCFG